tara:strand:- start:1613 stop:1957 length:345 start_codon:yes stop_codon:yes gene_type:complete
MSKKIINEDWVPSQRTLDRMTELFPGVDIQYEQDKFVDYYLSNGGVSANWEAAFRNWIRRADEYGRKGEARGTGHAATSTKDVSDRRSRILRVAKSRDNKSDGSVKRFPTRKRD